MKRSRLSLAFALLLAALGPACSSPGAADDAPPPPATLGRWTKRFETEAFAVAELVRIEGPPALRSHVVLPQDPARFRLGVRRLDDGYLQVVAGKTDAPTEIFVHLDNWQLVGTKRVEVLERTVECPVRITLVGDVVFQDPGTGEVRNEAELELVGELE